MLADNEIYINAEITSTSLGYEDHGLLTFMLMLSFGGTGQGFGGYCMDGPWSERDKRRMDSKVAGFCIRRILNVVGVSNWEDLPHKFIRVIKTDKYGDILGIANLLKDGLEFRPKEELRQFD
jgi:hypothetical protein